MSVNKAILLGHVGQDPNIRKTQDGADVASFSLATSEYWTDKRTGEKKQVSEWHHVVVFGQLATVVKNYVKKGSKLYIEGQIKTRKWTDKKDNIDRYSTEIVLNGFGSTLKMEDNKDSKSKEEGHHDNQFKEVEKTFDENQTNNNSAPYTEELDDEIPF